MSGIVMGLKVVNDTKDSDRKVLTCLNRIKSTDKVFIPSGRYVQSGKKYKHFKGNTYIVLGTAIDAEDNHSRVVVIYTRDDIVGPTYTRPLDMFLSEVDHDKYPEVPQKCRFEELD